MSTDTAALLVLNSCETELDRLLEELSQTPSRTSLYDVGAVAEVLMLATDIPAALPLLNAVRNAAFRWLRSGLLEDLLIAHAEFTYHGSLLCYMAQFSIDCRPSDMEVIRRLHAGGLIARSELPLLQQLLIDTCLSCSGVAGLATRSSARDLRKMVDRRVLRGRTDEFDLLVLIMYAQLLELKPMQLAVPRVFPQTQLAQAVRNGVTNWVPVLAFLCQRFYNVPAPLHRAALRAVEASLPEDGQLLAAPPSSCMDSEYIGRSERGLRLRSTLLAALVLSSQGEVHAGSTEYAAYA